MLFPKYPYRVLSEENLDYILEQLNAIRAASGVTFDDSNAQLGADTVQEAIDALDAALEEIALQSTNLILINDAIPAAFYVSGHVYTHLQTVNNPTLMSLISAIRGGKMVIMKRTHTEGTDTVNDYAFLVNVTDDPVNIVHTCEFYDLLKDETSYIKLNGLNDDANVYGEIGVTTVKSLISSFNGRNGAVEPESGDYPASLIPFDNADTGLEAEDVQGAIEEVNAKAGVSSFNNRDGAVEPESGDYPASMIPFNNTDTGLEAENVQDAIVEIKDDVLSSGVASFNGRNGAVNPQSGDYTAAMISYHNVIGNVTVNDVKAALDELINPSGVTVTLTLNGAKEDSITIKDTNNETVASCVFESGQTSGTVQIEVPVGGGTYKFISSVAKDTTTGTSDYEKIVTLTDNPNQTVDIMPDNSLYWYGNTQMQSCRFAGTITLDNTLGIVFNTNSVMIPKWDEGLQNVDKGLYYGEIDSLAGLTKMKCNMSQTTNGEANSQKGLGASMTATALTYSYRGFFSVSNETLSLGVKTLKDSYESGGDLILTTDIDISTLTTYPFLAISNQFAKDVYIYALWLE